MSPDIRIVKEILFTEQDYVDDLKVIIEVFMGGIQKDGCVTKEEMTLIFSNLQLLYGVNCQLLELLKKNETPKGIAESFISLADYLKNVCKLL